MYIGGTYIDTYICSNALFVFYKRTWMMTRVSPTSVGHASLLGIKTYVRATISASEKRITVRY